MFTEGNVLEISLKRKILAICFVALLCVLALAFYVCNANLTEEERTGFYSLDKHPVQKEAWYAEGNREEFTYQTGDGILSSHKTYRVQRFYAERTQPLDALDRYGNTVLVISARNQTRPYAVLESDLENIAMPDQGAVIELVTRKFSGTEYAISLKPIDFNDTSGLNIIEYY